MLAAGDSHGALGDDPSARPTCVCDDALAAAVRDHTNPARTCDLRDTTGRHRWMSC